jgi:hypothetical protein
MTIEKPPKGAENAICYFCTRCVGHLLGDSEQVDVVVVVPVVLRSVRTAQQTCLCFSPTLIDTHTLGSDATAGSERRLFVLETWEKVDCGRP